METMNNIYDAVLCVETPINETADDRMYARKYDMGPKGMQNFPDWDDPVLYGQLSFGNSLKQSLNNIGPGYSCKVTDFKKWVVVEVTYHNHITGRSSSKTFLIVFKEKGDGIILSTHNKYRTISGPSQASSYITSVAGTLRTDTQSKIG